MVVLSKLLEGQVSRAAAKHTTAAKRKCTTGVMGDAEQRL